MAYTVTFWGTRGSIPTPGAHTARYGGNTPCVAVEGSGGGKGGGGGRGGGQLVILDAGTGIRALGRGLVERQNGAGQAGVPPSHAPRGPLQRLAPLQPVFPPRHRRAHRGLTPGDDVARGDSPPADGPGGVSGPAGRVVGEAHRATSGAG